MNVTLLVATYGDPQWKVQAERAYLSCLGQGAHDIVVHHDDLGTVASSRNAAAERATGDHLIFCDADDELAPGYVAAMVAAAHKATKTERMLFTPSIDQVKRGRHSPRPVFFDRGRPLSDDNWLVVGTMLPKWLFKEVGGFGEYPHGFEDWSLWAKCWRAGATIVKVPDAVYVYYYNPLSKHKQAWRDRRWQVETHQRIRKELFPEL
jgi:glycosyltransferase involved in cell wall biosynthesis